MHTVLMKPFQRQNGRLDLSYIGPFLGWEGIGAGGEGFTISGGSERLCTNLHSTL